MLRSHGSLNDFNQGSVQDYVVRSKRVISAQLERQVIQKEHNAASAFAQGKFHRVLDDLPDFSVVLRCFEAGAELFHGSFVATHSLFNPASQNAYSVLAFKR